MSASVRNTGRATNGSRLPAVNSALKVRSKKELGMLKGALTEQLRQDMKRLLDDGTFADLILIVESERIASHLLLLRFRLAEFVASVVEPRMAGKEGDATVADLSGLGVTAMDLKNLLRAAYTEDNAIPFWNVFRDTMKSHDAAEPMECEATKVDSDQRMDNEEHTSEASGINDQVSVQPQEVASVKNPLEMNEADAGNLTATTGESTMEVCEYVGLETTAGVEPGTTGQKVPEQPNIKTKQASDRSQSGKSPKNSKFANKRARTHSEKSAKSDHLSAEAKPKSSNTDNRLPAAACHLGRDLLRIFTQDSGHDIIIKVDGKEIPAHRFMLCARSQYFSAMLEGSWRESSSSEVELTGFSHAAMMLALQFIYGGAYELPDGIVLRELLYLADMYGLDVFKKVIELKLRKDYCHFFHKPCSVCLERIPECLALTSDLDPSNLCDDIFSWLIQYLDRAWAQKTFAALPPDLLFKCRELTVQSFSPESAVTLLLQIDKLVCSLPQVSWTKAVHSAAVHLQDACVQYTATIFMEIVKQTEFLSLLEGMNWKKDLLEPVFNRVVPSMTSDTANATFLALHSLQAVLTETCEPGSWHPDAVPMVNKLYSQCYNFMVSNANRMAQARGWKGLPEDLRKRIKEEGVFIESHGKAPARKPVLSSSLKGKTKSGAKGT
ncbi:uncharacterized protein LOC119720115 [Patiria miniata]|uniref:BTB domain-containing protein n=1 Tax=Patiria miniata TaxID=46514 RepID=A0A913Z3K2_PATMI|nr:uncharacterized protein LOC119720115 [Patiria miniata]XP_038045591.1 uncharacterized protein LOC119720115 [Patiria miniata]